MSMCIQIEDLACLEKQQLAKKTCGDVLLHKAFFDYLVLYGPWIRTQGKACGVVWRPGSNIPYCLVFFSCKLSISSIVQYKFIEMLSILIWYDGSVTVLKVFCYENLTLGRYQSSVNLTLFCNWKRFQFLIWQIIFSL